MSAIGRLKSNSKMENLFGILYYVLLFGIPVIAISFIVALKFGILDERIYLWSFLLASTYLFILTNLSTLKDYCKESDAHKGTIEYFLAKLNITVHKGFANAFSARTLDKGEDWMVLTIFTGILSVIGLIVTFVIAIVDHNFSGLIVLGYNTFLLIVSFFINSNIINNKKVPSELLELMFEMENIPENEKRRFCSQVKNNIVSRGYITRLEVFEACSEILQYQERIKEVKKKENQKEEYTNFLKKVK